MHCSVSLRTYSDITQEQLLWETTFLAVQQDRIHAPAFLLHHLPCIKMEKKKKRKIMLSVSPDANLHLKSLQGTELCAAGPSSLQLLSPGLLQLHAQVLGRHSVGRSVLWGHSTLPTQNVSL